MAMRHRVQLRIVPLQRHLEDVFKATADHIDVLEDSELLIYQRPDALVPRDWVTFLLHSAAEVEHALMAQYLFAAYSLKIDTEVSEGVSTTDWQDSILTIAKEEMGHLLTVQNILRLIGGPICIERQDFPLRTAFYPFPFTLERLTKSSLAKYLFAEMSPNPIPPEILTQAQRDEITERARKAVKHGGGSFVNHVGTLYQTLADGVAGLADEDFRTDRADWQSLGWPSTSNSSGSLTGVKLLPTTDRAKALGAIDIIMRQGEASTELGSHFTRFLKIYDQCPEDTTNLTWPVATNPSTSSDEADTTEITDATTKLWAELFNIRYRMLLTAIQHVTAVPQTAAGPAGEPIQRILRNWIYLEMVRGIGSLRDLATEQLVRLPVGAGSTQNSGPTFGLPYTWALPDIAADRWCLHRDLIDASQQVVRKLNEASPGNVLLQEITTRDEERRVQVEALKTSPF